MPKVRIFASTCLLVFALGILSSCGQKVPPSPSKAAPKPAAQQDYKIPAASS